MYVFLCSCSLKNYLFYNFEFEAIEKSVQLMPQIKCTLCQILVHSALRGGGPVLKQFLHFMRMVIMYFLRAMNASSKAYFASGWHSARCKSPPNFHSSLAKQTIFMSVPTHFFPWDHICSTEWSSIYRRPGTQWSLKRENSVWWLDYWKYLPPISFCMITYLLLPQNSSVHKQHKGQTVGKEI